MTYPHLDQHSDDTMKTEFHQQITAVAIDQYLDLRRERHKSKLIEMRRHVKKGSKTEDTTPLQVRATNWHFYRSNSDIPHGGLIKYTSESRLADLIAQYRSHLGFPCRDTGRYKTMGRILHHIQDMSVPAHVMPIYHANYVLERAPDAYEEHMAAHYRHLSLSQDVQHTELTGAGVMDIYHAAAQRTLAYVRASSLTARLGGNEIRLNLSDFWRPADTTAPDNAAPRHAGFSSYGPLGNSFGAPSFVAAGHHYEVAQGEYRRIYELLYRTAIVDSVNAIAALETMAR